MLKVRRWVSRHAPAFEFLYKVLESVLVLFYPLVKWIGYGRLEKPVAMVERVVKGFLFDTQMCGSCTLSATGMVCPMNCPKSMRNGPCGGVRSNGHCEIKPEMPCVWRDAYHGSLLLKDGYRIREIRAPVDHRLKDTSSWLREIRRHKGEEPPEEAGL